MTENTEPCFLPIPSWLATAMEGGQGSLTVDASLREDRIILPLVMPQELWGKIIHRIPEKSRNEIFIDQVSIVWEKTLGVNTDGTRKCVFIGIGVANVRRTIVDFKDFEIGEEGSEPEKAKGPLGIVLDS